MSAEHSAEHSAEFEQSFTADEVTVRCECGWTYLAPTMGAAVAALELHRYVVAEGRSE